MGVIWNAGLRGRRAGRPCIGLPSAECRTSPWLHLFQPQHFDNAAMLHNSSSTASVPTTAFHVKLASTALFIYFAGVYFHAATASLSDAYQPGLGVLKRWVQPEILLWVPLLLAYCAKSARLAYLAKWCGLGGLACCGVLFVFCSLHAPSGSSSWVAPEARSLGRTVYTALLLPSFSNRSLGTIVGSAIFALLQCALRLLLVRKLRNKSRSANGICT